jgi:hypothetical protein
MALPTSGPLTLANIQTEFGGTNPISLSEYYAGGGLVPAGTSGTYGAVPSSGTISIQNFYGTQNRVALSVTYASSTANASLNLSGISGYIAGISDITVTVNSGVYLYATSTGSAGLGISGGTTGDTLTIVNNGFIIGQGGNGYYARPSVIQATSGGPALSIPINATINNTNGSAYIAGGGGGGAGRSGYTGAGGGGAGGGAGGNGDNGTTNGAAGGGGGGLGAVGGNGAASTNTTAASGGGSGGGGSGQGNNAKGTNSNSGGGGGGGRILPGSGGAGGVGSGYTRGNGGAGGSANAVGANGTVTSITSGAGGGGGGWGASGGAGASGGTPGSGGRAVQLNGRSVTWVSGNTTRVYGAVS